MLRKLVVLTLMVAATAAGQDDPPHFREKVQSLKKKKLIEELNLSADKTDAFLKLYDDFAQKERSLHQERRETFRKLVHMSALGSELSDDQIVKVIESLNQTERKIQEHHERVVKDFRPVLQPAQIAKMIVFEQNFQNKMRNIVIDVKGKRNKMKQFIFEGHGPPDIIEFEDDPY